ncbi:MAG: preprotein translocase subunit SecG [Candidatus Aminicenantales bacterium]
MSALITIIHVAVCLILVVAVLMQSGKAADLAGAFGGVGSATAFGARGTQTILSKLTTICAILFMFTSLGLWILSGREAKSAVSGVKTQPAQTQANTKNEPAQKPQTTSPAATDKDKKQPEAKAPAKKVPDTAQKKAAAPGTNK